jgi:uncharacterized GH25 family protein
MLKKFAAHLIFTTIILICITSNIFAHELWIDPENTTANMQTKIAAHVRVGQNFSGQKQYYIPEDINETYITDTAGRTDLKGIIGDELVFDQLANNPGLQILTYHSNPLKLTYNKFEKFEKFVRGKGLDWVLDEHKNRGLPELGFYESYVRYAKALITRGSTAGSDKQTGLMFELIALKNPYEFKISNTEKTLPIKLLWKGNPFANSQISVFENTGTEIKSSYIKTNQAGIANLLVTANGAYLLNAVQITAEKPATGVAWKSHWASLTFKINAQ